MKSKILKPLRAAAILATASVIVLTGVRALTASATQPQKVPRPADGLTAGQLVAIAKATARRSGDTNPSELEAVRTTRGRAGQLIWPGAGAGSDRTPVYAITMRGKFTAYQAPIPAGGRLPTGSVISIVVGATGRLKGYGLDFNLTTRPEPNLRAVGRLIPLG
jgi:hypothetical protein